MNRVIITGPTGAIGMALIEYLNERNVQVIAVVRGESARKDRIKRSGNVAVVECALTEMIELPQRVREVIRQKRWREDQPIGVFYHLAWDGTFGDSRNDMYLQNKNVKYALNAVDAAAELGCAVFIGAGSQAEYGRYEGKLNAKVPTFPENGYGMAKLCAGQMTRIRCEQKGIKHIWTRILSVYGPYDGSRTLVMSLIGKMLKGEKVSCTKGEQVWDYLYSVDAAKMMYLLGCYGENGKIYCLGSGEEKPLREYIEIVRNMIDTDKEIGFGDIEYSSTQVMYLCADIQDLIHDTGYVPDYTFEKGVKQTIEWYRNFEENESRKYIKIANDTGGGYKSSAIILIIVWKTYNIFPRMRSSSA